MVFFLEGGSLIINQVQTYIRTQMMPRFPIPASDSKSIGFCRPGSGCMYAKSSLIAGKFAYLNIRVISACPANTSTKLNLELSCKSLQETTVLGWEWYLFDLNQVKDNTCVKRDVTLTCPASHSMGYPSIGSKALLRAAPAGIYIHSDCCGDLDWEIFHTLFWA